MFVLSVCHLVLLFAAAGLPMSFLRLGSWPLKSRIKMGKPKNGGLVNLVALEANAKKHTLEARRSVSGPGPLLAS